MLDWLACALVKGSGALFCALPPSTVVQVGTALGRLAYYLQPKRARIGYLNLKAAFGERLTPPQARRVVRRVFGNLGAGFVEMLRLSAVDRAYMDRYVHVVDERYFDDAVASGRPVIVLTGHFGNWELCPIVAALKGHPVTALARAQDKFPKLYRMLVASRESKGCRIVHKGGALRKLVQALEQREPVGIVGDQSSRQGIFVDFFGRPALFTTGPFELAQAARALIVPAFIHRVQGPFHRLVVEPPIDLAQTTGGKDEVIRWGIERFAQILGRHVEEDPAQWLWMHKRWKRTPARRALILSDGKLGHVKQSLTVLRAMHEHSSFLTEEVIEVRYRHPLARGLALAWAWCLPRLAPLTCLRLALEPACFRQAAGAYADLIISCGASTAPVNVLLSADNRAKSIVIMNPSPIPLRRFTLALVPAHDRIPSRRNVVRTLGALSVSSDEELEAARRQLTAHPRFRPSIAVAPERPVIAVLIGGDTDAYELTTGFAETLMRQVLAVCDDADGVCLVTTSRRTQPAVEQYLSDRLGSHPRCPLLLLAGRDALNGTMAGILGWARVVVVTGESVSMLSEACASGRPVVVVEPPRRPPDGRRGRGAGGTKARRFIDELAAQGYVHHHPLPEVGHAIRRCLSAKTPARRLETYAAVRDAVARLL